MVVGSGCSGLTAALVAAKHGLRVLVVEKTRYFGGTTAYSGGGLWIPNNQHQPAIGIRDSAEKAACYLQQVIGDLWTYDDVKLSAFLQSGPEMVRWLEDSSIVRFKPVPLPDYHVSKQGALVGRTLLTQEFDGRQLGAFIRDVRYPIQGYSAFGSMQTDPSELPMLTNPFGSVTNLAHSTRKVLRYAADIIRFGKGTEMGNGNALVGQLTYFAREEGVTMWNNTPAIKTVMASGDVIGLQVLHQGAYHNIKARKGVVLARGGFARSERAKEFIPHDWKAVPQGNTGDDQRMGVESGGVLPPKNLDNAIFAPISLLKVKNGPIRRYPHFAIDRCKPGSTIGPDGKRFANESEPYQEFVSAMHHKGIHKAYYIGEGTYLRKYGMGMALPWPYPIWRLLHHGYLISAPSISELAAKIDVNPVHFQKTVEDYNRYGETGRDLEFHRGENEYDRFYGDPSVKPNPNLRPCVQGPFYAAHLSGQRQHTPWPGH